MLGGRASRSTSAFTVSWWFSFMALPGIALLAYVIGGTSGLRIAPLLVGLTAGIGAVVGGAALFLGLARAPASSVVPTSGFMTALIPVAVASTIGGEHLTPLALVGVVIAVAAIWLVASDGERFDSRGIWYGVASGTSFGVQFAILGLVDDTSGLWPLVGVFTGATLVGTVLVFATGSPRRLGGRPLALTAGGSACSIIANTAYLTATRLGSLSLAAILAALYAIPTVVLAAIFLRERLLPRHWAGLALAGLATAFVAM